MKKNNWLYTSLAALALATVGTQSAFAEETQTPPAPQENKEEKTQEQKLTEEKAQLEQDIKEINGELETLSKDADVLKHDELTKELAPLKEREAELTGQLKPSDDLAADIKQVGERINALTEQQNSQDVKDLLAQQEALSTEINHLTGLQETDVEALKALSGKITALKEQLAEVEKEKGQLEEAKTTKELAKTELETRISELEKEIAGKGGSTGSTLSTADQSVAVDNSRQPFSVRVEKDASGNNLYYKILDPNGELMELVNYSDQRKETVVVDPSQPYLPNDAELSKHVVNYINELRVLNGLPGTLKVSETAQTLATQWAERLAKNNEFIHRYQTPENNYQYTYEENMMYYSGITAKSDQELAYRLVLDWFADYINIAPLEGVGFYGHRATLLSDVPDFALSVKKGTRNYYAVLNSSTVDYNKLDKFTLKEETKTENGRTNKHTKLLLNGKEMVFLPRVTFEYVTDVQHLQSELEAKKEELKALTQEVDALTNRIAGKDEEISKQEEALSKEREQERTLDGAIKERSQELVQKNGELALVTEDLKTKGVDTEELKGLHDRKTLLEELQKTRNDIKSLEDQLNQLQPKVDEHGKQVKGLEDRRKKLQERIEEIENLLRPKFTFPLLPQGPQTPSPTGGIGSGRPGNQDKETGVAGGGAPKTPLAGAGSSTTSTSGNKTLPNTGDASALASMGLGLFLSSLGLAVGKRRRNKA